EAFGVPMLYFHDWPDMTIHTNKDVPDNLDATKLGRVAYMTAGIAWTLAALPDADAAAMLVPLELAATNERLAQARRRAAAGGRRAADAGLGEGEGVAGGGHALTSIAALWPGAAAAARRAAGTLPAPVGRVVASRDPRVPVKDPVVRGDLEVYYYDYLG